MDARDLDMLGKRMPTEDVISRQVLDLWDRYKPTIAVDAIEYDGELKKLLGTNLAEVGTDLISRQAALDCFHDWIDKRGDVHTPDEMAEYRAIEALPSAQPNLQSTCNQLATDCISRQAAIKILHEALDAVDQIADVPFGVYQNYRDKMNELPPAQPERTCVNCGRTANNGGWYADGRTRCPIEEHYALPKDGFCHLWEKRNITDDDYPERRTDGRD